MDDIIIILLWGSMVLGLLLMFFGLIGNLNLFLMGAALVLIGRIGGEKWAEKVKKKRGDL